MKKLVSAFAVIAVLAILAVAALAGVGATGGVAYWAMAGSEAEAAPEMTVEIPTAPAFALVIPQEIEIEEIKEEGFTPEQIAAWQKRQEERRLQAEADRQTEIDMIDDCSTRYKVTVKQAQSCRDLPTKQERRACRVR
ncbi:hypothetical protein HN358_00195 [Candidatus Uhrbacteria bacterium]|nr:hypothetical protein [Candidatus Uhrbacteria bacterium]MBT7717269.1 hypothetical protein [Candidatus Uhrbacteria bacterium]